MLSEIFQRFVKASPISVMIGGLFNRVFCPDELDRLFEQYAKRSVIDRGALGDAHRLCHT